MSPKIVFLLKASLIVFYIAVPLSLVLPPIQPYSHFMLYITAALALAHVAEYVLMRSKINALPGRNHFINTLLFGFVYWLPLQKAQQDVLD